MRSALDKEWQKLLDQEQKLFAQSEQKEKMKLEKKGAVEEWVAGMEEKIPEKLVLTLEAAFDKAFYTILTKGTDMIGKTFQGEDVALEFQVSDFRMDKKPTKKAIQQVEKGGKKSRFVNSCITTVEGIGFGALGIGLPDIPVFLGMLLKGLYEIAASYGFDYKEEREQILMLRIIQGALGTGEEKRRRSGEVDDFMTALDKGQCVYVQKEEVSKTSKCLSQRMLAAKFVQGFFVIGALGGAMNLVIYRQVMDYAILKYKKRYFISKRKDV